MNLELDRSEIPAHLMGYFEPVSPLPPQKNLLGIPWMLAFALRADGWYLRSDIIWAKPNPMPESVEDRPSKAHEYLFLLTKAPRYFYDADAIREPHTRIWDESNGRGLYGGKSEGQRPSKHNELPILPHANGANSRTVWTIPTRGFAGAHFATMPIDLAERCIKAGTSERGCCPDCSAPWVRVTESERVATRPGVGSKVYAVPPLDPDSPYQTHKGDICGNRDPQRHITRSQTTGWLPTCSCPPSDPVPAVVFDPFGGAGTTEVAARRLGRSAIITELSAEYAEIARARLSGSIYDTAGRASSEESHPLFSTLGAAR